MAKVGHLNMGVAAVVGLLVIKTRLVPEVEVCLGLLAVGRGVVLMAQTRQALVVRGAV